MSDIAKNLKDLLEGNYKYAKNSRSEEFKTYSDFRDRFVKSSDEEDLIEAFYEVFQVVDEKCLPGFFWLASSYNVHLYKVLPRILSGGLAEEKKKAYLESCLKKYDVWPESTFALYTANDKIDILKHIKMYGIKPSDQARRVLS